MLDNFALALTHALMAVAVWRLLQRPELDEEPPVEEAPPPPPAAAQTIGDRIRAEAWRPRG